MSAHSTPHPTRRDFLRRSGQVVLGTAALPLALNLAAIGRAAAFNASGGDYKALVCLFMFGGNDGNRKISVRQQSFCLQSNSLRQECFGAGVCTFFDRPIQTFLRISELRCVISHLVQTGKFAFHQMPVAPEALYRRQSKHICIALMRDS